MTQEHALKWLFAIETESDLIVICRLMNAFRRKAVKPLSFAMSLEPEGYGMAFLVALPEPEVEHYFNFFRRTEGVRHVDYYRHTLNEPASFVFVNTGDPSLKLSEWPTRFAGARLVFASHGKALLELPADFAPRAGSEGEFLLFARVRTTRGTLPRHPDVQ